MEVVATAKWVRTTARKARLVTQMVEGLPVAEALVLLRYSPRSAARDVAKVIKSAAANAEHNYNLDSSTLRVARVEVDGATIIKRWRAKPRGMVGSVFKRTSHLRAFVTDEELGEHVRKRTAVRMPRAVIPAPTVAPTTGAGTSSARRRRRRPEAEGAAGTEPAPVAETATTTASEAEAETAPEAPKPSRRMRRKQQPAEEKAE
ncbi:MAG: 50S ribosomal protein L22 [Candidatus Dormibacteraeota bacterium]|nr:50S ribosomal protein L22 [Candidatus Dormibacteraeota bacterium]MBV9525997.1 50S ribosomal protein L22 [Candidatus Dormibacteraeota bacterium]